MGSPVTIQTRFGTLSAGLRTLSCSATVARPRREPVGTYRVLKGLSLSTLNQATSCRPITFAIRSLRVNGIDERLSIKAIETVEFQSARKTSKSP